MKQSRTEETQRRHRRQNTGETGQGVTHLAFFISFFVVKEVTEV